MIQNVADCVVVVVKNAADCVVVVVKGRSKNVGF